MLYYKSSAGPHGCRSSNLVGIEYTKLATCIPTDKFLSTPINAISSSQIVVNTGVLTQLETVTYSDGACNSYITTALKPFSLNNCTNVGTTGGLWYNATIIHNATVAQTASAKQGFMFSADTTTK